MQWRRNASATWRTVTVLASLAGLVAAATLLGQPGVKTSSFIRILGVCAVPSVIGLVAAIANIETRTRILLLWLAALVAGFAAVLTLFAGPGIIIFGVMIAYLVLAWMLNESGEAPSR